jgi:hypothetical protein
VFKANAPTFISPFYYFTITIIGQVDTEVTWLTEPDLGTILNGATSTLYVAAINRGGRSLQYRIAPGTDSKLPQGLTLQPSGNITGRVSFNTFALDGGTTTFDTEIQTRLVQAPTTFDLKFDFTVNAFSSETEQVGYQVGTIVVTNGGSGYNTQPTITISAPPNTINAIQATAGVATIVNGVITAVAIGNPGRGYTTAPTVTITGGGGTGATAVTRVIEAELTNAVSVFRRFTVTVDRYFNEPYQSLYIKCMPPQDDRALIDDLVQNQDIIPVDLLYRPDDPNFGVARNVTYVHAYGLDVESLSLYVQSLDINHYWKNLTLGEIKTAQALDANGQVLYEVVYSEVIDDLVNNQGQSVSKEVTLPYPVNEGDSTEIDKVYPNSLINMRTQVIDTVGQIPPPLTPVLPLWMTSKQTNGRVLGFTPAWVICYTNPGQSGRVAYNIRENFRQDLNVIDFKVDRYEIDRSQTYQWNPATNLWDPQPPVATTFDLTESLTNLTFRGRVDYATELAFEQINHRTLASIAALGGIDGETGAFLNNKLLIFKKQEGFTGMTNDEAFTDYLETYDQSEYDQTGTVFDESVVLPLTERLSIYRITVTNGIATLALVAITNIYDYVLITRGDTWAGTELYLPPSPTPGLLIRTWSLIPEEPGQETIFDGGSTRFITPADRWTDTDEFDKYLVFPRTNILN